MAIMFVKATRQGGLYVKNLNYDTAHDAASGTAYNFFAQNDLDSYSSKYYITRSFFYFDTSSLEGVSISASRLILWAIGIGEVNAGHGDLYLVEGVQHIPLIGTDYGDELAKTTSGGTISREGMLASYVAGIAAYVFALPLNGTGLTWIVKDGNTKCCLRISGDKDDMTPESESNIVNMGTSGSYPGVATSDATSVELQTATLHGYHRGGTEDPPYLEVTYEGDTPGYPRVRFNYGKTTGYGENTTWQLGIAALVDFSESIEGLDPYTTYHFRAEIEDAEGTDYGADKTFLTVVIPSLLTELCTERTAVALKANGEITSTGGANPTRRGFCYLQATEGDPTTSDSVEYEDGSFGTGVYSEDISGLDSGLPYRVRAYATNSAGTGYGETVDSAVLVFDPTSRVSSIRRIYRPGLYRMEIALGDLGFEWDVSEVAMRKIPDEVKEPEGADEDERDLAAGKDLMVEIAKDKATRLEEQMMRDYGGAPELPTPTPIPQTSGLDIAKTVIGATGQFLTYATHPGALVTDMIKRVISWLR